MDKTSRAAMIKEFERDTAIVGENAERFLQLVYPGYLVDRGAPLADYLEEDPGRLLSTMAFYRIVRVTVENADDLFVQVNERFEKLFTALHSIGVSTGYGVVSYAGATNLVLCINEQRDAMEQILAGMLPGADLEPICPDFSTEKAMCHGLLSGVPSTVVDGQRQTFSLAPIMRALGGEDYTLLFLAKPVPEPEVSRQINGLIQIRDAAFAVSKRNISRASSYSESDSHTENINNTKTKNSVAAGAGAGAGAAAGAGIGAKIGAVAGLAAGGVGALAGATLGTMIGGAIGGGLGTLIGSVAGGGKSTSHSHSYSDSITKAVTENAAVSGDIQNGFAMELVKYADQAIERLKGGRNNGMWQMAITYGAQSETARNIIAGCLCGELSKPDPEKLPLLSFTPPDASHQALLIPKFMRTGEQNPLCALINSSELGLVCTIPTESVPDFELRTARRYPILKSLPSGGEGRVCVGNVADGKRVQEHMPFAFGHTDLTKHTFVCGMTGSGKTTTVKQILTQAGKPFLVIESAKKEYRNLSVRPTVYTMGRPEINCPRINPFAIMPGVSPQTHIDYLKDLFNASFSFYGPMPYILERCLHNIYRNKGWNLTLGYHPLLANTGNPVDFFDYGHTMAQYGKSAHKYLFPTMQELKDEVERYMEQEMNYDGEVAGNIKTAIKVRLESLCVGAKGFTFNTCHSLDVQELLRENVVFELEGLADDADKAFSVGLLVIFVNEYRQVHKERRGLSDAGLQHLLVIEEAHRLLKNIDTERSSESMGNPKGKAVEHFTNMIAEMRSYGQGVIVAEQIPSKLAPDVIKNSSNKIIQRVVSADDQQMIANTIGIPPGDAVQLGMLETKFALCHKEGMALPVHVRITPSEDIYVSDEQLFNNDLTENLLEIDCSTVRDALNKGGELQSKAALLLNTLLIEEAATVCVAVERTMDQLGAICRREDASVISTSSLRELYAVILSQALTGLLVRGVYRARSLPPDSFISELEQLLVYPTIQNAQSVQGRMASIYPNQYRAYTQTIVAELVKNQLDGSVDIEAAIGGHFTCVSRKTQREIAGLIRGGANYEGV